MFTSKVKENFLRLWQTDDLKNHDLAFSMLDGFHLSANEMEWLWTVYNKIQSNSSRRTTLVNFPNVSKADVLKGRILEILFSSKKCPIGILAAFRYSQGFRMPYCTIKHIPDILLSIGKDMETLTWQDGELERIDKNIIALEGLRSLDLRRQPITYIDAAIAQLPRLEEIHLVSTSFIPQELSERHDVEIYTDAPY